MDVARWSACKGMAGLVVAALLGLLLLPGPMHAAGFVCAAGDVACLIAAIHAANANGEENTITLAAGAYTLTAVDNDTDGANGLPSIMGRLTITGAGADTTIIERAAGATSFRLMHVAATGRLTLEGLMLKRGSVPSSIAFLSNNGGSILNNAGTLTLTSCTLTENTAAYGGGGLFNSKGTVNITTSTLANNMASVGGGSALRNDGGVVTLMETTLAGNHTDFGPGGALFNDGTMSLTNSMVAGNMAGVFGGGIFSSSGRLTITNTTFAGNRTAGTGSSGSPRGGGAIWNSGGTVTILNTTLAGNTAPPPDNGGGLFNFSGTMTLQNTILARNTAEAGGPDCWGTVQGTVTSLGYNLLGDPTGCTITLLDTDLTGDPKLGDFTDDSTPGGGYFPLLPDSPAIDAGHDEVCPETDQLGQPRVGRCDIGAIEFQPPDMDVVAIRHAIFVDQLALLFVVATSSAAPDAELFVTVPECLTQVPMPRIADRYILVRAVPKCGDLDAHTATVASSHGGVASAPLR
jgi:hypothetical protein